MRLVDGVVERLDWPAIELHHLQIDNHRPLLLLHGPEPDHDWREFAQSVVGIALGFRTELVVGLGSYPAAVPHTRSTRLACTASSPKLIEKLDFVTASLEIPAGIQASRNSSKKVKQLTIKKSSGCFNVSVGTELMEITYRSY